MALKKRAGNDRRAVQNAMKTLLANIRFASVDKPIQTLAVTSSKPKEGKSTTACNLARAIASSGASVVLVECDMRRRSLANMLGVHSSGGIYAVLSEQATLDEALVEVDQPGMFFLDCEPHIPNPADLIASRRFADLISQLENRFIIAHPERCRAIQQDVEIAQRLVSMGCKLQASADFIAGGRFGKEKRPALKLLNAGLYDYVASDAHNASHYRHFKKVCSRYVER